MIRIVCGDEPEELVLSRDEHLARARIRGAPPSDKEIVGYDVGRELLAARHLYHCAYCELFLRHEAAPIEHYRPKGTADDVDWSSLRPLPARGSGGGVDTDAERLRRGLPPATEGGMTRIKWRDGRTYWWLAWTWENHLYGCTGCNSGLKLTRFHSEWEQLRSPSIKHLRAQNCRCSSIPPTRTSTRSTTSSSAR